MHTENKLSDGRGGFKNIDLETLRVIAIALVLIDHLPVLFPWAHLNITPYFWGYGGVDLFFVISGYIITTSLLRSIQKTKDHESKIAVLKGFWVKRVFRILPMAYLWTLIPILLAFSLNTSGVFGPPMNVVRDGLANVTQTANFHAQACVDPATAPLCGLGEQGQTVLGPYWSLSTEEQFYMVVPLLLLFLLRRYVTLLMLFTIAALVFVDRQSDFFFTLRLDGLAAGVLLALFQAKHWYQAFYPKFMDNRLTAAFTLLFACLLIGAIPALSLVPFTQTLLVIICTFLVFCATFDKDFFSRKSKVLNKFWAWGGDRSYAFYLIHVPIFSLANEIYYRTHNSSWDAHAKYIVPLIAIPMLLILTELCTRYFENPLRERGRRIAKTIKPLYVKPPSTQPLKAPVP